MTTYETEAPSEYVKGVDVCISEPVTTIPTVPQHATMYTLVVKSSGDKFVELAPLDALRVRMTVVSLDNPVVICHSRAQAMNDNNQVASVPRPAGYLLSNTQLFPLVITSIQQLWVAATADSDSRVSVIVERRDG
jgi:hypothetical protein